MLIRTLLLNRAEMVKDIIERGDDLFFIRILHNPRFRSDELGRRHTQFK